MKEDFYAVMRLAVEEKGIPCRLERMSFVNRKEYMGLIKEKKEGEAEAVSAVVNLDVMYDRWCETCETINELSNEAVEILNLKPDSFDAFNIENFEDVKKRLFIRISKNSDDDNVDYPKQVIADKQYMMTYHVLFGLDSNGLKSCLVKNNIVKRWGIDNETLSEIAMDNAPKIFRKKIVSLHEASGFLSPHKPGEPMVVTNEYGIDGAAALFYPGVLSDLQDHFGGDFYVIPSSIHEVIATPIDARPEDINNSIEDVNSTCVSQEDILGHKVLRYDSFKKELIVA